jgi:hypothetical protein
MVTTILRRQKISFWHIGMPVMNGSEWFYKLKQLKPQMPSN